MYGCLELRVYIDSSWPERWELELFGNFLLLLLLLLLLLGLLLHTFHERSRFGGKFAAFADLRPILVEQKRHGHAYESQKSRDRRCPVDSEAGVHVLWSTSVSSRRIQMRGCKAVAGLVEDVTYTGCSRGLAIGTPTDSSNEDELTEKRECGAKEGT